MILENEKIGLEKTLRRNLETEAGRQFLGSIDETKIAEISQRLVDENSFGDTNLLRATVSGIWGQPDVEKFVAHSLWCAHREAISRNVVNTHGPARLTLKITGLEHLEATAGHPTILISPMTLCLDDAMDAILSIQKNQPNRKIICYGEDMEDYLDRHPEHKSLFAGYSLQGIREIYKVLRAGGIFITYPDFVYSNHPPIFGKLFGITRAFSAGLITIAASTRAVLLPIIEKRVGNSIEIQFFQAIEQQVTEIDVSRQVIEQSLVIVIAKLLEYLILRVPFQWRLLPTLSYESPEMA